LYLLNLKSTVIGLLLLHNFPVMVFAPSKAIQDLLPEAESNDDSEDE